jgi:hypothetical protein
MVKEPILLALTTCFFTLYIEHVLVLIKTLNKSKHVLTMLADIVSTLGIKILVSTNR